MKLKDLFPFSFENLRKEWMSNEELLQPMAERMRNDRSAWCLQMQAAPYQLTEEQVRHAAERYLLGGSRSGDTVFWLIDQHHQVRDGIVGDTFASALLKQHGVLDAEWCPAHCLFGLHLLGDTLLQDGEQVRKKPRTVAVVESVKSCVLLSEGYPEYIWMATGCLGNMNAEAMMPLIGHHIVCFPNTDPTGTNYVEWIALARKAKEYHLDISVSSFLEQHTSPTQKERKIDLVDYLWGNS